MRGVLVVAVLAAAMLSGCGAPPRASLDDLLVRQSDLPEGWRLMDFDNDLVDGDATYPMATNPQAFSRVELQAFNWSGTDAARAIAFVRDDAPADHLLMFWSARLEDQAALIATRTNTCFTADDAVVADGRNAAYVVAYRRTDLGIANGALANVAARTSAGNLCPATVRAAADEAPPGAWGVTTGLAPGQGYATFRFTLDRAANVTLTGDVFDAVLLDADDLARVGDLHTLRATPLAAGAYVVRVDPSGARAPSFTLTQDGPQDPNGHHGGSQGV